MVKFAILLLCILNSALLTGQDIVHEMYIITSWNDTINYSVFVKGDKIKVSESSDAFIIDLSNDSLFLVFPEQKVYWEGNWKDYCNENLQLMQIQMDSIIKNVGKTQAEMYHSEFIYAAEKYQGFDGDNSWSDNYQIDVIPLSDTIFYDTLVLVAYETCMETDLMDEFWVCEKYAYIDPAFVEKYFYYLSVLQEFYHPEYELAPAFIDLMTHSLVIERVSYRPSGILHFKTNKLMRSSLHDSLFYPPSGYSQILLSDLERITKEANY